MYSKIWKYQNSYIVSDPRISDKRCRNVMLLGSSLVVWHEILILPAIKNKVLLCFLIVVKTFANLTDSLRF
jgi:hypothetical protein